MKNYILALMLIPLLLHGQKFRDSEVKFTKDGEGKLGTKTAVMESVPRLLSYQGFLTDGGGPVSDGQRTVTFRLFEKEEGGLEFWTETHLVTISDGLISALLGSKGFPIVSVPMKSYLEIEINGDVLSPRQQITSVLYSVLSDSTNFAKGYTKTVDLSEVAHSGEYVDLLNAPDLTPFATKDTLSNFATMDTLFNNFTLSSQLSVVALSNNYYDLDSLPNLEDYAVTDTLDYYVTEVFFDSTIVKYVSHDSLDSLIGTTIQSYDSDLEDIAMLDDDGALATGHLIIYDEDSSKWVNLGGDALRNTLGLGTISTQDSNNVAITGGTIIDIEPIAVESGGTGASNADTARINLDAQQHSDWLDDIASFDLSENDDANQILMSFKGEPHEWALVDTATARVELGLKIGATADSGNVQAWDSKLQNFSDGEPIPDSLVFSGDYFITTPGVEGQFWSSDGDKAGIWTKFSRHFQTVTEDSISIKTGTEEGDIVELELVDHDAETNAALPVVDGSQLFRLDATQISSTRNSTGPVSNEEFVLLEGLRSDDVDTLPDFITYGPVQGQLDLKAHSGVNEDITEIKGLTTKLAIDQGGTGGSTAEEARTNLEAQQQNPYLDDLSDGQLSATAVQFGEYFINDAGDPGHMWMWKLQNPDLENDEDPNSPSYNPFTGKWDEGADITRIHTDSERGGLNITGDDDRDGQPDNDGESGDIYITVDAGTDIHQIVQLVDDGAGSGSLPIVDGSQLTGLDAEQINSDSDNPVSNAQFHLLTGLRTENVDDSPGGNVQDQLDRKQKQSDVLDDIVAATVNPEGDILAAANDLLIYKSETDSWELLQETDTYKVTKTRIEYGDFFITDAGNSGQLWMSDGSEAGKWATPGQYLTFDADDGELDVNVGTAANEVIALNAEAKLPAVDASLLVGLKAEQINFGMVVGDEPSVTNAEFNALGALQLDPAHETILAPGNWNLTGGSVQAQLDKKQNLNDNLSDLADGELTYSKVEWGEYFIKSAGEDEMVWTWDDDLGENGNGSWIMPPGAQVLNDLEDASTENDLQNVFIGSRAGENITNGSGSNNAGFGMNALQSVGNGNENVALGIDAGLAVNNNNANVLVGYKAGSSLGTGDGNVLIGYKAGEDLTVGSDQLIIDNSSVDQYFIEGSFETRDLMIDGQLFSTRSLHLGSSADPKFTIEENLGDITIKSEGPDNKISFAVKGNVELLTMESDEVIKLSGETKIASDDDPENTYINFDEGGSNLNLYGAEDVVVNARKDVVVTATEDVVVTATEDVVVTATEEFTLNGGNISLNGTGTITINNESGEGNKISFMVDDDTELLKIEENIIKLVAETKIAADDNLESYINATDSGVRLNVKGKEKVLVHAVDENDGVIQLLAKDSVNLNADNIVITSENEFTVSNDMRVGGEFRVSPIDDDTPEFSISYDGEDNFTLANETGTDILFAVGVDNNEVMRIDGDEESLLMGRSQQLQFANNTTYIHHTEAEILEIVAPTLNLTTEIKTNVSTNLHVGSSLTVGDEDEPLTMSQVDGDVLIRNVDINQDLKIGVTRAGPTEDYVLTLDGTDGYLKSSKKIDIVNNPDIADNYSQLRFVNTGRLDDDGTAPIVDITALESDVELVEISMDKVIYQGKKQGKIKFDAMFDDQMFTFMEINTDYDDPDLDTMITIHKDLEILGRLYTKSTAFARSITPEIAGEATIGEETLPWGDLYLYDGNGISDESAHIYFQSETELGNPDVTISHDPTFGIRIEDDKQLQFNTRNNYIKGTDDEILTLVAPTLAMKHSTADTPVEVKVEGNINPATLTIGANNNEFTVKENPDIADEILITSTQSNKDVVFRTNMGGTENTEVMRIFGENASLRMEGDQKVEFNDANTYIHSSATDQLDLAGNEIVLKTQSGDATIAKVEGTLKAAVGVTLYEGEDDEFRIYQSDAANDYIIKNETVAKDVLFVVDKALAEAGQNVEVMRVVGADASLRMTTENPVEFLDADHYIKVDIDAVNPDLKPLNVVAQGTNSIIKIGKTDATAALTTDSVAVVGNKVQLFADNFGVKADVQFIVETDEINMRPLTNLTAPTIKLWSNMASSNPGVASLPAELVLERNSGTGFDFETLGKIVGKGQSNPVGEIPQEFASILFKSAQADESDPDGLRGGIYFKTLGSGLAEQYADEIMDINGTKEEQVTIKGDLDVKGDITMAGAAFTAPITSDERGVQTIGVRGDGEWKALHLWDDVTDGDPYNASITFGSGTDAVPVAGDIQLKHDPITSGLTLEGIGTDDSHRLQFRDNNTYIHSSGASILDIVAPTLNIDSETVFTNATSATSTTTGALQVTGGISTQENIHVGGDATLTGTFNIGTTAGSQLVLAETASGSGSYKLENTNTDGNIVFTVDDNNEAKDVMSLVGANASLRMNSNYPLEFNVSTNSITGTDANSMTIASPNIRLNASGGDDTSVVITNAETTVNNELELTDDLVFSESGTDKFTIKKKNTGDSYVLKNEILNNDIIFRVNQGGTDTEVMRVEGGAGSLLMAEEQKLQFAVAANYISSTSGSEVNRGLNIATAGTGDLNATTGGDFNLTATGALAIGANSMSVTAANITKTLTSGETIESATAQSPKLTIANSTTQSLYGGILEFNKSGTTNALENPAVGTIQGTDENGAYAKMDLIMETRGNGNQNGAISFSVMQSGAYKQLLDINKENANTVSIGTADDPANLKVFGSMLLETTSFEKSILPGARGVQNIGSNSLTPDESGVAGLYEWGSIYLAEGGQISIGGSADQLNNGLDVTLTQVMSNAGDRGLLLNVDNKLYFEDDNVSTGLDQFIGSSGGGTTLMSSPQLDIAASSTLNLISSGSVAFTSATTTDITSGGNLSLTTPVASKLIFNTNTAGTISHTSDLATEDLTIEQLGAVDASLIISSAGTGVDAIAISASAGGIDITATGNADTEDLDITTVGTTTELRLTSASTEADAIELDAEAGGIIAKVFDGKTLQLSNAGNDTYIKLNAHGTPANETIEIMNAVGTGSGSIAFTSSAGGVDINGGTGVTVDGTGISIDGTTASNFTVTGAGTNLTLAAAGGGTQQLVLGSAGTDAQAINIDASGTGGGIDIDAEGDISMNATNITMTPTDATYNVGDFVVSGTSDNNAALYLYADAGDDNADKWLVKADGVSASAEFSIGHYASGDWVSYLTIGADKKLTAPFGFAGDMASEENVSDNVMTIQSNSSENAALILNAPSGGVDINGGNLIAIDATPASGYGSNPSLTITNTATVNEQDFTITQAGTFDASLALSSAGTGADAIKVNTSAGGIDIDAAPVAGFGANPSLTMTNTATADAQDLTIAQAGAFDASLLLSSTGTGTDAIGLNALAGDISIMHAAGKKVLFNTNIAGAISHTSDAATEDFTIEQLGAVDASLALSSTGTGADAIKVNTSAGGIDIDAAPVAGFGENPSLTMTNTATADAQDLTIAQAGAFDASLILSSTGTGTDAVNLEASAGGVLVSADGNIADVIKLHATAGAAQTIALLNTAGTSSGAIAFTSVAGGINIDAASGKDVSITGGKIALTPEDNAASAITLTTNTGPAETIVITNTLGTVPSAINLQASAGGVLMKADGSLGDAIKLHATAGGIDIFATDAESTEDIDIWATGSSVNVTSTANENGVPSIYLQENGGTSGTIKIHANLGEVDGAEATPGDITGSILLRSDDGGIGLSWADGKDLWAEGGRFVVTANEDAAEAIKLHADAGASQTIQLINDAGTAPGSIEFTSSAGGVDINAATVFTVAATNFSVSDAGLVSSTLGFDGPMTSDQMVSANPLTIRSTASAANAVLIETASGSVASSIMIHNDTGNSATEDAASIQLLSDVGGIGIKAGLGVNVTSTRDVASSIYLQENGGTSGTIKIHANLGEVDGAEATPGDITGSILLGSDAGGIGLSWADGKDLWAEGGRFVVTANEDAAEAIKLHADAGASQTIQLINDAGTASGSIAFTSSAGGVDINAATTFTVAAPNFSVSDGGLVSSTLGFAGPMTSRLMTSSEPIVISSSNDAHNSVQITSTVGGIDISALGAGPTEDIDIVATGSSVNISSSEGSGATDAITINASAGGIDINSTLAFDVGSSASVAFSSATTTTIDATGVLDIDGANTTIDAAGTLTIKGTGVSKYGDDEATLNFDGSGAVTQTDMTNVTIDPSGTLTMQGGGISKYGDDVAWWKFDGDGAVTEENMTSIAITPSAALTLTAGAASTLSTTASALTLTGGAASTWSTSAGILTVSGDDGLVLTAANSAGITMNSINGEFLVMATGQDIDLRSLSLTGDFTGALSLDAVGTSNLTNDGALTVAATGASGALTLTGAAASTWSTSAGELTLDGAAGVNIVGNAGEVDITTSGIVEMNSSSIDIKNIAGSTAGLLKLYEDPNNGPAGVPDFIAFKTGDVNGSSLASPGGGFTFTWPNDYGATGQVLKTDGVSGVMTWETDVSVSGSVTNSNVFGSPLDGTDVSMTFDGHTHSGLFKWMEDEDKFEFRDHILMTPVSSTQLQFGDPEVYIWSSANARLDLVSDGSIVIDAGTNINLEPTDDVILPANVGLVFGDGESIEGNNTDLTVTSGADIVLSATTNVNIPQTIGLSFATDDAEKISSDGTDLTVNSGGDIILSATTNVNIPQTKGLSFATDDAEKISSNGTDLTVTSGADIILSATTNVNIPQTKGLSFSTDDAEKISSDGTDLTVNSGGSLILTATGISGSAIKDQDDMSSDSPTHLASQQSIKAYVDDQASAAGTLTNKTLTTPEINDASSDHQYVFAVNELVADRTVTLPLLTGHDEFVFKDHIQTLTYKTLTSPKINEDVVMSATATELNLLDGVSGLVQADFTKLADVDATAAEINTLAGVTAGTVTANKALVVDGSKDLTALNEVTAASFITGNAGTLKLMDGDGSNYVTIAANTTTSGSVAYTWPAAAPASSGYVLQSTTAGVLSWAADATERPEGSPTPNSSSDRRLKKNISTVSGALEKLSKLNPVNYNWRKDEFQDKGFNDKKQWGFIAQEVEKVMPELVGSDEEDFLTLNYNGFVPLLTKAMQEQQTEIDNQQKEIDELKAQLEMIMKMMQSDMSDKTDNKKAENNEKPVKLSMATVK